MADPQTAPPSRTRNFFGGIVDRLLPGAQYNSQTGQYSNVGRGLLGRAASIGASFYGGPGAGALVNNLAGQWIDGRGVFNGNGNGSGAPGPVVPQIVGTQGGSLTAPNLGLGGAPTMTPTYIPQIGNNGFGNNYVNPGPTLYQPWSPQSQWGSNQINGQTQPTSPFDPRSPSAQEAANQANNQNQSNNSGGNGLGFGASADLMLGNMDRLKQQAQQAMNKQRKTA